MTVAIALLGVRDWFREKYGWQANECGVQFRATPALNAGLFYVAIDDSGVEVGRDDTESLDETVSITIGIWRRAEHLNHDLRGNLKLPEDIYMLGAMTLDKLERMVVVDKPSKNKFGLHGNWEFRRALNSKFDLPHEDRGADFKRPFRYRGRGVMETEALDDNLGREIVWFGYKLRFRGLEREQVLHKPNYALG